MLGYQSLVVETRSSQVACRAGENTVCFSLRELCFQDPWLAREVVQSTDFNIIHHLVTLGEAYVSFQSLSEPGENSVIYLFLRGLIF